MEKYCPLHINLSPTVFIKSEKQKDLFTFLRRIPRLNKNVATFGRNKTCVRTKTAADLISGTDVDPEFGRREKKPRKEQTSNENLDRISDISLAFVELWGGKNKFLCFGGGVMNTNDTLPELIKDVNHPLVVKNAYQLPKLGRKNYSGPKFLKARNNRNRSRQILLEIRRGARNK